jgi:hypothetical protein
MRLLTLCANGGYFEVAFERVALLSSRPRIMNRINRRGLLNISGKYDREGHGF